MHAEHSPNPLPDAGFADWQRRRGRSRVRVYFCCCPLALLLAPPLLVGRLVQRWFTRQLGGPVGAQ